MAQPGSPANKATNSVWTVPVAGNHPGEDCHQASFTASFCNQGWRWNLDYVVDAQGNTMSYFYEKETNRYGRYNDPDDDVQYVRGGWLDHINYGTDNRSGTDTVNTSTSAPMRVQFSAADRCASSCWSGSEPVQANWTDTPWDQSCSSGTCANSLSPTFWTTKRLASITTKVWNAGTSSYSDVDQWTLTHTYPDPGDGTRAGLWLESLQRTGKATGPNIVGSPITLPEINFDWVQMPNRVDTNSDGEYPMNWMRMSTIWTDTGAKIDVRYSDPECVPGSTMPASPQTNTLRCYPVLSEAPDSSIETDYFHKYVVTSVTQADRTGGGPDIVTSYEYVGGVAWRHADDDGLTKDHLRTWSDYRGYGEVKTRVGDPGAQSLSITTFFRGMHGDLDGAGGTRSVTLPAVDLNGDGDTTDAADAPAVADEDTYAGMTRQTTVHNGTESAPISTSVNQPWQSPPTASRDMGQTTVTARYVGTTTMWSATKLEPSGWQVARSDVTLDNTYGMLTHVDDQGDVTVTGDEKCTVTTYNRNPAINLLTPKSRVTSYGLRCASAPAVEADIISDTRLSYDNNPYGTTPTRGDVTKVELAKSWSPSAGPTWFTQSTASFDAYGRVVGEIDVRGNTTTTTYTPAAGGPVTSVAVTGPLGTTTNTIDPARGKAATFVDPNGKRSEVAFDALGRTVSVWPANRLRSSFPNAPATTYSYTIRNSGGVNAVVTAQLNAASTSSNAVYTITYALYDGLVRPRQVQTASLANGQQGTVFTDTSYDERGQVVMQSRYFDETLQPSTTLQTIADWQPKTQTRKQYDLAGRATVTAFYTSGAEQWRVTASYHGNRVNVVGATGGGATTTISDARGRVVETRRYHDPAEVGSDVRSAYDLSTVHYDPRGYQDSITDNAGNVWSYTHDILGRLVATDDPDKGNFAATYNDAGDTLTTTDGRGQVLAYSYDSLGRRTGVYEDAEDPASKLATWTYDPFGNKGQLATASRWLDSGTVEYRMRVRGYTALYQSTGEDYVIPATPATTGVSGTYRFSRTYRADGSPATMTYPPMGGLGGETVTVLYDGVAGLPEALQTNTPGVGQYVFNTDYTVYGEPTFVEYKMSTGSWLQQLLVYDDATRRLAQATTIRQTAPQAVINSQYSYDDTGNITRIATNDNNGTSDVQCFGYDYYARLAEAWTPASGDCSAAKSAAGLGGPAPYWQSWSFDPAGSRETQVDHATAGEVTTDYDRESATSAHALTSTLRSGVTQAYGYDLAGNTICRPSGTVANDCVSEADSQVLSWSAEGLLESVVDSTGTSSYVYAADGSRLLADDPTSVTLTLPGAEVKRTKATGSVTATRYYSWNGNVVAMKSTGGAVTWLVGDHHGTHLVSVAAGTQAVATRRQKPFGEARGTTGTWPNPKGFVGGNLDATGLVHIGARSYDPTIGSFISSDPVFDPGDARSWTGYAYAGQTPITASDPTGLKLDPGDGGGSGSGVQTWIMNPMACATLSCYRELTQGVQEVQQKIETQRSDAILTGYNTCATRTCYDQYVEAVDSGQYDMVDMGGNMVTTDGSQIIVYTPESMMEALAAPPPPPEPAADGCAWWKCAMNFVSDYVAPVLTVVALATAWIPVWGQVIGALALVANVISAINSVWDAVVEIREHGFTWAAAGHLGSAALSFAGFGATALAVRAGGNFVKMFGNLKAVEKTIPRRPHGSYKLRDELESARGSLTAAADVFGGWMAAEFTLDMANVTWSGAMAAWGGTKGFFGSS